jgi:hypothetical protein
MASIILCRVKDILNMKLAAVTTKTIAIMSSAAFIRIDMIADKSFDMKHTFF